MATEMEQKNCADGTPHSFRTPFFADGNIVLDGLGYTVAQFLNGERIEGENAAEVIADAVNRRYGVNKRKQKWTW